MECIIKLNIVFMNMKNNWQNILEKKVKEYLDGYSACHDYWHLCRVRDNALEIAEEIESDVDVLIAAALLHDVGYKGNEHNSQNHFLYSMEIAKEWLPEIGFPKEKIPSVLEAIRLHDNYYWEDGGERTNHTESLIIQDADRIDAIGVIGTTRIIYYFGEKGYPIFSQESAPKSSKVLQNHDLIDQIARSTLKKWHYLNYDISKKISKNSNDFATKYYELLKNNLNEYHKKELDEFKK